MKIWWWVLFFSFLLVTSIQRDLHIRLWMVSWKMPIHTLKKTVCGNSRIVTNMSSYITIAATLRCAYIGLMFKNFGSYMQMWFAPFILLMYNMYKLYMVLKVTRSNFIGARGRNKNTTAYEPTVLSKHYILKLSPRRSTPLRPCHNSRMHWQFKGMLMPLRKKSI